MIKEYIKSDLYRCYGKFDLLTLIKGYFRNPSIEYLFWFRLSKSKNMLLSIISKIILSRLSKKYSIQIPWSTQIGYGLYLGHGTSIVINPITVIGNNCNLSQFTTIGSNEGKAATIGDNVYIAPGTCIVEDVKIGDNVTIGAGSVVVIDVKKNATSVGNPNRTVHYNNPERYIKRKWKV